MNPNHPLGLMDGVIIPYHNQFITPEKPAFFYYRSSSENSPILTIKSETENSYFVCVRWVDYS